MLTYVSLATGPSTAALTTNACWLPSIGPKVNSNASPIILVVVNAFLFIVTK